MNDRLERCDAGGSGISEEIPNLGSARSDSLWRSAGLGHPVRFVVPFPFLDSENPPSPSPILASETFRSRSERGSTRSRAYF